MKKFAMLMAVVMVTVFSSGVIVAADAPEKATVKDVQKTKPAVTFNHKAHAERIKNCAECHHKDAAGKEQKLLCLPQGREEGRRGLFEGRHAHEVQGLPFEGRHEEGSDEV